MSNTTCVECNSEIPEGTELCPECGFPTEAGKATCPECLNPVDLSQEACPECGFPLDSLRQGGAAAEPAVPSEEPAVSAEEPAATEEPAAAEEPAAEEEPAAAEEPAVPPEELARAAADELDEPAPEPAAPLEVEPEAVSAEPEPAETEPPQQAPVPASPLVAQETIVIRKIDTGDDLTEPVLKAQIDSLNQLTDAIAKLIETGGSRASEELAVRINELVTGAEAGKNEMLTDLIASIGNFVETSEKIKDEMLTDLKEQSLTAVSTIQQVAESFASETQAAAEGIKEAQKGAIAEINNLAQQIKAAAAREAAPKSDFGEYLFYICLVVLFFTAMNIVATAYVVKLVR
ncbi:zinc ribbon domain-containing protein [Geomesophilobacter sediminis]|uniref:Zinc ribbon domain-containing protein n=1 Tax=Geomesophilobacter sediminis TaxID=2798584 RepID=A0A8J7M2V7_9BACT|nr:zinc ribbon domain-containing protein [Geomesophilobacter sediminis]MBJ6727426.1 zinc ribbon domain-containing protein [Geomesophilobacter sediminis]